jgi:NAD(P)-dependent dehydrogenase (short-subunit alcohol dehydrogenase family)
MNLFDLAGKVALVTGGSSGLGRAMALGLADAGAAVVVTSRTQAACDAVVGEIRSAGHAAIAATCDVADWNAVPQLARNVYDELGRVDVLINNAGFAPPAPSIEDTDEALHDQIFAVNEKGPFRMMAVFGPRMVAAGCGSIINVSSFGAEEVRHRFGAYSAAKAGLNALTIAFAQRLSPHVRVNTISPGMFETPMLGTSPRPGAGLDTPLGRPGRPEEIVTTALYLASDWSSYTTGANIRVDGLGTPPLR